jgi:hypothetical protein
VVYYRAAPICSAGNQIHVGGERSSFMAGRVGVLALIAGMVLMHVPQAVAALPKPIHTTKFRFRIPFKFDATGIDRKDAREVQLHVSTDQGNSWELAKSMSPESGKFDYQTPAEGEYWFSVKMVDGRNQLHPPRGVYETGLIVIVDQTSPALELTLNRAGTGRVQLTWRATDPNLDINSIRIEALAPDSKDWTVLPVEPQSSGEYSWSVAQSGTISVRGIISDFAGNSGEAKTALNLNGTDEAAPKMRPARRGPIAEITPDVASNTSNGGTPSTSQTSELKNSQDEYQGPIITPYGGPPRYQRTVSRASSDNHWPMNAINADQVPFSQSNQVSPQFVSRQTPPADLAANRRTTPRHKIVMTRQFQIGYKLDDIGPSGISEVQLFITEDNGRKWWKYGNDPDQKSPFDVEVPRDGVYGFAIRVSSGAGLTPEPPANGEPPEIIVAVDQTPPAIELQPIQQGKGANANRVVIRWKMTEDHPADKPISIYYAASANGPWEPITGWKEDLNGAFEWVVGPGVPNQFYIRVMGRDVAGNVGKVDTTAPIIVDMTRPSARIVDVEATSVTPPQ